MFWKQEDAELSLCFVYKVSYFTFLCTDKKHLQSTILDPSLHLDQHQK